MKELTSGEVDLFLEKFKKRGERTLSVLGKLQDVNQALNDPLGKVLLKWLITQHEELLDKVADLSATDVEKIRYTVVRELLLDYCDKIQTYRGTINEIKKVVKKGD